MSVESADRNATRETAEVAWPLDAVLLACLGRLLFAEEGAEPLGAEQHWLFHHYRSLHDLGEPADALARCLEAPAPGDEALVRLAGELGLDHAEVLAVSLALQVEEQPMMGRLLARLQDPVGGSRPTLGLLAALLAPLRPDWLPGDLLGGAAVAAGVLRVLDPQVPLPERVYALPAGLVLALRGKPPLWPGVRLEAGDAMRLPPSVREEARRQALALRDEPHAVLALCAAARDEARAVAAEVAAQLNCKPLFIADDPQAALDGLGAACRVAGCLPVFEGGAGAAWKVPLLAGWDGPRLVLLGPDGQADTARGSVAQWTLTAPSREERQQLWQGALGDPELAAQLAVGHVHSAGRIAELARLARREAGRQGHRTPTPEDLRRAAWASEGARLGSLAQPLREEIPDQALVLPRALGDELQHLLARCRHREGLERGLGASIRTRYQAGVRCLLVGPSGTGKTLAAGWLATRLGLPLYRVDLASVVSKYIGETEKNLAALLARAEHSEIVLLFDEADALFGKRTDIKDSNDRFANSQTNYLLQRIEGYRGIVLLTSNSRDRFDSAFTRRLDRIIEFPLPGPQERRALWRSHLGDAHGLDARQINQLAMACDLAGGHIRNAVLSAAVSAAEARRPIVYRDVLAGLAGEYRKLGRQFPGALRERPGRGGEA